ncbi:DoxX family protein [Bacteriovorax sp. PP10]|uniref:DoxX family protein n=1 Tax=Bacteriovorax antarcticus TaxID=3088717 RepID=A0ABU5VWC8_9BACT|nr:DoxX family protein [Bacteriovorax sp. PP10]MEA9357363.1 DoxX family protein [Bacteriovorax sp. PP10]
MIKKYFQPSVQTNFASTALFVLRLIAGIAFIIHGMGKIQSPLGWLPANAPIHIPALFQFLAAVAEFAGGIAWILGLLTPLASFGISINMLVATSVHLFVFNDPFVTTSGGTSYEPALGYFAIALVLMAVGPGKFSLDKFIFGEKNNK